MPNAKDEKDDIVYIWSKNKLWKSYTLAQFEKIGKIYYDGEFGNLVMNQDETQIAFLAEKKPIPSKPFATKPGVQS